MFFAQTCLPESWYLQSWCPAMLPNNLWLRLWSSIGICLPPRANWINTSFKCIKILGQKNNNWHRSSYLQLLPFSKLPLLCTILYWYCLSFLLLDDNNCYFINLYINILCYFWILYDHIGLIGWYLLCLLFHAMNNRYILYHKQPFSYGLVN